ncbi:MAG: ABC transporter ATP-binding protein [Mycoplasmatales bacterium]
MIELKSITKKYKDNEVLKGINLKVKENEILAITGASGSGKTTLLNILGLLDKPNSGSYLFDSKELNYKNLFNLASYRGKKIGFVVQNFALVNELTIKENFDIVTRNKGNKDDYQDLLNQVGLDYVSLKTFPLKLSGGEQQRVAIARSLLLNPSILLCDEPTGNLDQKTSKDIFNLFKKLQKSGKTIIIVTHDLELASNCDRVVKLVNGKLK